jgi:regulator of sigma E protease
MDFLLSIPYIVLLLGGLIFFHELGHFLLARWHGVHVVTFSIGFGPVIMRIKGRQRGDMPATEYVIAALPLGGYVRMLGHDPAEVVEEAELPFSFETKTVWQRFTIMVAGPGFNLILPYIIYFIAGVMTAQHMPSAIGMVNDGSPAQRQGIKSGDRLASIQGEDIHYWWQLKRTISNSPGVPLAVEVDRPGVAERVSLTLTPEKVHRILIPGILEEDVGRVGITPDFIRPSVAVVADSSAWRAGLRSGDLITAVDGQAISSYDQLIDLLDKAGQADVALTYRRIGFAKGEGTTVESLWERSSEVVTLTASDDVPRRGVGSLDCTVRSVMDGTHAKEIGLAPGDVLLSLDGQPCRLFGFLISKLAAAPDEPHRLVFSHGSEIRTVERSAWMAVPVSDKPGETQLRSPVFGLATWVGLSEQPDLVNNEHVWAYAVTHALDATHHAMWMNVESVLGLLRGAVPVRELSGPIGIAKLASEAKDRGWSVFFGLMVYLSISLGLLNLLPIPVLDGGHIMFLAIEAVQRRPVSLRTRQIATYMGLAFIIFLMVLVMKFDLERVLS